MPGNKVNLIGGGDETCKRGISARLGPCSYVHPCLRAVRALNSLNTNSGRLHAQVGEALQLMLSDVEAPRANLTTGAEDKKARTALGTQ